MSITLNGQPVGYFADTEAGRATLVALIDALRTLSSATLHYTAIEDDGYDEEDTPLDRLAFADCLLGTGPRDMEVAPIRVTYDGAARIIEVETDLLAWNGEWYTQRLGWRIIETSTAIRDGGAASGRPVPDESGLPEYYGPDVDE